jgi:hypothetical protein
MPVLEGYIMGIWAQSIIGFILMAISCPLFVIGAWLFVQALGKGN